MYNELAYGGYLIYKLYPQRKVFIDLRGDVYLCCELKDYYSLIQNKYQPDTKYKNLLDNLWNKYNISYAILDSTENTVQSRIGKTLINDPNWNLVFWDDNSQIFIKNDRKNTNLLTLFSAKAASPYDTTPIRKNNLDLALQEYRRMISIADSARSRNAIGYILFKEGKMDQAQAQFQKALQLNNNYDSPYMNLGELFLLKKDTYTAIKLYQKALSLNPGRAFIYIRLGELYLRNGESGHAKQVWQKGLDNIQEATAQRTFKQLLQSVY
jgi:tetratricopeptide (TPR) repeat protein